jgi:putative transposase
VSAGHSTINRWVICSLPMIETLLRKDKRKVGISWRVDDRYVKVKGFWKYLYRAVCNEGKTIDFLLIAQRDTAAVN